MRKTLAAAAALIIALAPLAQAVEVVSGSVPSNGKPPSIVPGGSWNGSSTIIQPGDLDGYPYVRPIAPIFEIIPHRIGVTLASAGSDSSTVPFPLTGYRAIKAQIRLRQASFAATGAIVLAFKGSNSALTDSTALGFWFPLGTQSRKGKTIRTLDLTDRWQEIPLADSLTNQPMTDLYGSVYVTNLTGAQIVYDLSFVGVK